MTVTVKVPSDLEDEVAGIPDLEARLTLFLRHEAKLETLRQKRHSAEAREIAERVLHCAAGAKSEDFDWDASFNEFERQVENINMRL